MRDLVIVSIWIGFGLGVTGLVATALESAGAHQQQSVQEAYDPVREPVIATRSMTAAVLKSR